MNYCKRKIYDVIHTFYACDKYKKDYPNDHKNTDK